MQNKCISLSMYAQSGLYQSARTEICRFKNWYHCCWWPDRLRRQVMSNHDTDYSKLVGYCHVRVEKSYKLLPWYRSWISGDCKFWHSIIPCGYVHIGKIIFGHQVTPCGDIDLGQHLIRQAPSNYWNQFWFIIIEVIRPGVISQEIPKPSIASYFENI